MELEKKYFQGLNADDDVNLLQETDYINAENFRIGTTDVGSALRLESIGGMIHLNTQSPVSTFVYTPIGATEDEERRRIIYFLHYSEGNHQIRCYDRRTLNNYKVIDNTQAGGNLNLSKNSLVQAKVYGDLLVYSDDNQEIKIINIEAGIKANNGGYATDVLPYSFPLTHEDITLLRRPPVYAPTISKEEDALYDLNFIENQAFQFAYRYFYRDFQYSVIGIWSKLVNYNTEDDPDKNWIKTLMPTTEVIPQTVIKVELLVKNMISGGVQAVRVWDKEVDDDNDAIIAHNSGTALRYDFYNNKSGIDVPQAEQTKIEENIPRHCKTLDTARKRLFIANYLEGFPSLTKTSLTVTLQDANTSSSLVVTAWQANVMWVHHLTFAETWYVAYWVYLPSVSPAGWYEITTTILTDSTGYLPLPPPPTSVAYSALTFIGVDEDAAADTVSPDGHFEGALNRSITDLGDTVTITGLSTTATGSFKCRSPYQVGIAFYDRLKRRIGMFTSDDLIIDIPDRTYAAVAAKSAIEWLLVNSGTVAEEIPEKAYYYGIVMTKNLRTRNFVQTYIDANACRYAKKEADTGLVTIAGAAGTPTDQTYIAIDRQSLFRDGMGWAINDDDLARIYFYDGAVAYAGVTASVLGEQGRYVLCELVKLGALPGSFVTFDAGDKMLVELYTPYKPSDQEEFYEVGLMYAITDPETAGRQYGTLTGLIIGDVYLLERTSSGGASYMAEAMSTNDKFWTTWFTDTGRTFPFFKNKEIRKPYSISFSNVYVIGTQSNGLSAFEAFDTEDVSPENGAIQKLLLTSKVQDEGTVMLIICINETNSMYLGEAQISDSNSTAFFVKSTGVIGSINALRGSYGTMNAESVILHRGQAFWFDAINGAFIRYDVNGLFPISDYKMRRAAKLFGDKYLSLSQAEIEALGSRPFVFGGIDPHHNEVLWALPKLGSVPKGSLVDYSTSGGANQISSTDYPYDIYDQKAKVLVYKISAERWQGAYTFQPHQFIAIGSELFSLKNGGLWEHNAKTFWNSFYGTSYRSRIMFAANKNPSAVKIILSSSLEGNAKPEFTHFRSEVPYEQSSDLIKADYVDREGQFYAGLYRDRLSPNVGGTADAKMLNGDRMRTAALRCMMEFSETASQVYVRFINVTYNISSGHLN